MHGACALSPDEKPACPPFSFYFSHWGGPPCGRGEGGGGGRGWRGAFASPPPAPPRRGGGERPRRTMPAMSTAPFRDEELLADVISRLIGGGGHGAGRNGSPIPARAR